MQSKQSEWGRLRGWVLPVLFCGAALGVSTLLFDRAFSSYDDGIAAEGARLILLGKLPYRDFWALYAPGSYYVNALLFTLFGESFVSIRVILPMMVLVQSGLLYGIIRRVVPKAWAGIAAGIGCTAWLPIGITTTNPLTYWYTITIAVVYFLVRWIEDPRPTWEYACGISLGLATLFRQDGGLYTVAALLPLVWLVSPKVGAKRFIAAARVFGSFAAVIGVVCVWFAAHGGLGAMYQDTIAFALTKFPHSRHFPYPIPWHKQLIMARYYTPQPISFVFRSIVFWILPALLIGLSMLSIKRLVRREMSRAEIAAAVLTCLAAVLFLMVRVRPVGMRVSGTVVLSLIVFAALAADRSRIVRAISAALLLTSVIAYIANGAAEVWGQRKYGASMLTVKGGIYTGKGYAHLLSFTSAYIRHHTAPNEKILSGSPAIYLMASRDPATVYFEPHPCLTDTVEIQQQIIKDIERERVRYFVRSGEWDMRSYFTIEPENRPRMLIRYINTHFKQVVDLGILGIYERKPS